MVTSISLRLPARCGRCWITISSQSSGCSSQLWSQTKLTVFDNNASERSIKPMVLSRRNWLFAGSEEGGQTAATIMSVIETCKRLRINPFEYMKDVLTGFPSAKTSQIDDFLPDRWLALREAQSPPI